MVYDVVVLGATGFTGRLVVERLATNCDNVSCLFTARSKEKMEAVVANLKAKGTLRSVECYTEFDFPKMAYIPFMNALVSYGTWSSLVNVMLHLKETLQLKKETFPPIEPDDMKRNFFHCRRRKLWYPYPGPDEDVIEMSERFLQENREQTPVYFKHYTTMPFFILNLYILAMFIYFYLSYFNWFAKLLLKFPRFFTLGYISHEGPTDKTRENVKYTFSYIGKGREKSTEALLKSRDKVVEVKVSAQDPYGTSALVMVIAAITLLQEQSQMPSNGVVNVGAAFDNTSIVERLTNTGIKFEVLS